MYRVAGIAATMALATFGLAALSACAGSGDAVVGPSPSEMVRVGGDNQAALIGHDLPLPLAVIVKNSDGSPAFKVNVVWSVATGGGTISETATPTDAQGVASVTWTLGNTLGAQSVTAQAEGLTSSPVTFTATARPLPMALQRSASGEWDMTLLDTTNVGAVLTSVWGVGASNVVAVGKCRNMPITMRYTSAWTAPPAGCTSALPGDNFVERYTSVWGSSPTDVFAVRQKSVAMFASVAIDHYDGQSWTQTYARQCSPCGLIARAVWTGAAGSAIAVGDSGTVLRYNGSSWTPEASGTSAHLMAIWGTGANGTVFAVGDGGTIIVNHGTGWTAQSSGTTQPLYAVWGASASDVFAAGAGGIILHYNGTAWSTQTSGTTRTLRALWGTSGSSVIVVGDGTTILGYDGSAWTPQRINTVTNPSMDLSGVWGSSPTNVIAVGAPK
jgi:Macroglobulin domain MG4